MGTAFVQCIGGVSGDMLLGALLDAGLPLHTLRGLLEPLGVRPRAWRDRRASLMGTRVSLEWDPSRPPMGWEEMRALVERAPLAPPDRERARGVLTLLEEAEGSAHGKPHPPEELGTPDTVADIVGVVGGLRLLGVERLYASPLPAGLGVVDRPHGALPAPAPATLHLLARFGVPVRPAPSPEAGETLTPTGVALLCALAEFRQPPMRLRGIGYGLGARNPKEYPNALALWLGEALDPSQEPLILLETNLDDATPQALAWVQERLLALGARDAWLTPVLMKKGRPGVVVSALVDPHLEGPAVDLLLRETPTLGVRRHPVARHEAEREVMEVETPFGPVRVKVKRWQGRVLGLTPEYEDCRARALERGAPLGEVLESARQRAREALHPQPPAP